MKKLSFLSLVLALVLMLPLALATEAPATAAAEATAEPAKEEVKEETKEETKEEAKEAFPNYFAMVNTTDINGEKFDASVFAGKVLMINIWADWCPPCRGEMPDLNEIAQEYKDKITLVGLLPEGVDVKEGKLEVNQGKLDLAKEVYTQMNITYPTLVPEEILYTIMAQTGVQAFPTTWFVDGNGYIVHVVTGAMSKENWTETIDKVLETIEKNKTEETSAP